MPFGVDDFLFLLASTSAVLWAKRGDFAEMSVFKAVSISGGKDWENSSTSKIGAGEQRHHPYHPSPRLPLLRGFDLDEPSSSNKAASNNGGGLTKSSHPNGTGSDRETDRRSFDRLVDRGVVPSKDAPLEYPNVPHRHGRSAKKRKQMSLLARQDPVAPLLEQYDTPEELVAVVRRATVGDLAVAHRRAERDGDWEQSLRLLQAAVETHSMMYVHKDNVEATLRTLLIAGQSKLAVHCYLQYAQDMLLSDEILVTLFACCNDKPTEALAIYRTLLPYRHQWSAHVYACALTTNAAYDWQEALRLYDFYASDVLHEGGAQTGSEGRSLLHLPFLWSRTKKQTTSIESRSGATLHGAPVEPTELASSNSGHGEPRKPELQYLYHVIVPLVAQHVPARLEALYKDMLARDPNSAPDVLIRCLAFEGGEELAIRYLTSVRDQGFLASLSSGETMRDWQLALLLFNRKRTTMNLNSLLRLFFRRSTLLPPPATVLADKSARRIAGNPSQPVGPISVALACRILLASLKDLPVSQEDAVILTSTLTEQQSVQVPDASVHEHGSQNNNARYEVDAEDATIPHSRTFRNLHVVANPPPAPPQFGSANYRVSSNSSPCNSSQPASLSALSHATVTTGAHWRVACTFASAMAAQKHYHVLPPLAVHMARQGKWAAASRAMSIALSCRRGTPVSVPEMSLCVAASVYAGRWNSALFWIERAHTTRMVLPEATYDAAFSISKHCTWQVALRALTSMRHSGGMCTERGVLDLMEMGSTHRQTELTLKALSWTNTVQWVP